MQNQQNHPGDKSSPKKEKTENPEQVARAGQDERVSQAHQQADEDIANDPEASASSPNDDLDEGELARLGENPEGI